MNVKRMVAVLVVALVAFSVLGLVPEMDNDAENETDIIYLHGNITSTIDVKSGQTVIVNEDTTITSSGRVIVEDGYFIVNKGVTVKIEGSIRVEGDALIDGTIVSKSVDGLQILPGNGKKVVINGTINSLGDMSWAGTYNVGISLEGNIDEKSIIVNGDIINGTNGVARINQVYFDKGSTLTVLGRAISNEGCYLAGTITVDNEACYAGSYMRITIAETSAIIDLVSAKGVYYISDEGLFAYTDGGVQYYVASSPSKIPGYAPSAPLSDLAISKLKTGGDDTNVAVNNIELHDISNVRVTGSVTTFMDYDADNSKDQMCADTKTIVSAIDLSKTVEACGASSSTIYVKNPSETVCFGSMTMKDADLWVYSGAHLDVIGDVSILKPADASEFKVSGTLAVEGLLILKDNQDVDVKYGNGARLTAAKYTVKDADKTVDTYYTTLSKAISNGATDIQMFGTLEIEEDVTVPASVKLKTDVMGYVHAIDIGEGSTLTIADGAKLVNSGSIYVYGSLIIENINNGITLGSIHADFKIQDGLSPYVKYCNVYVAFGEAKSGDVLRPFSPCSEYTTMEGIIISKDTTLPSGVKYEAGGYNTRVVNGCTFTVDGELCVNSSNFNTWMKKGESSANPWHSEVTKVDDYGWVIDCSVLAIGETGVVKFDMSSPAEASVVKTEADYLYAKYKVSGAYFANDTKDDNDAKCCISRIPNAFAGILDAKFDTVFVYGDANLSDIKITGTETERFTLNFVAPSKIAMSDFIYTYGTITFEGGITLSGTMGTPNGSVDFGEETTVLPQAVLTFSQEFSGNEMHPTIMGGLSTDDEVKIGGTVYVKQLAFSGSGTDSKLVVKPASELVVNGTGNMLMCYFSSVIVEGKLTVTNNASMTAVFAAVCVLGTLDVQNKDGHLASITVTGSLIVGATMDDFDRCGSIGSTALVTGSGSFSTMNLIVMNGSTVDADVLAYWMDETAVSTEFNVDGAIWCTIYAGSKQYPLVGPVLVDGDWKLDYLVIPAMSDSEFQSWQTYDSKSRKYVDVSVWDDVYIGDPGYEKIYAKIVKKVYSVTVTANVGIDNVFIDGEMMLKDKTGNTSHLNVAAGTHEITYTLANGYSGNAVITAINGERLDGGSLTFIANDDKAGVDRMLDIALSGIQKSGYDTDPDTHTETSDGLSITEILLVLAVIIMAVMAVILILRLNRS